MGVIGGSRLSSYLVDAAMQVGCGEAAWAIKSQALAFFKQSAAGYLPGFASLLSLRVGVSGTSRGRLACVFFYFGDALFGFTNVFCDRGDFGLWSSGWGSAFVVFCRAWGRDGCAPFSFRVLLWVMAGVFFGNSVVAPLRGCVSGVRCFKHGDHQLVRRARPCKRADGVQ